MAKYSTKVFVPQYEPKHIVERSNKKMFDITKYKELLEEINEANISDEDKSLLRFSATRHIVFNYSEIADYYAVASKEVQELMEKSALVIIDVDDAIANGYVRLSKRIKEIVDVRKEEE